ALRGMHSLDDWEDHMHQNPSDANGNGRTLWRLAQRFQLLIAALVLAACGSALALERSEEQTVLQALQAQTEEVTTFVTKAEQTVLQALLAQACACTTLLPGVEQAGQAERLTGDGAGPVLAPATAAVADMGAGAQSTLPADADQAPGVLSGRIIPGSDHMVDG